MDLYKRFGLIGAAGDRHLAEFCPPSWYLKTPEMAAAWKFLLTPVSFRIKKREALRKLSASYCAGTDELIPAHSGEESIQQIKALLGLGNMVTNINFPNKGQLPGFPMDAIVETNAFLSRGSVQPIITNGLPAVLGLLALQHVMNQEEIVEAGLQRDLETAFRVFLNDPQVRTLTREDARKLFLEMTHKTLTADSGYKYL
jgi:alpha-galactosidase